MESLGSRLVNSLLETRILHHAVRPNATAVSCFDVNL